MDAVRIARAVGADVADALSKLKAQITEKLKEHMEPADMHKDVKRLQETIRSVTLLDGFGIEIDVREAKATIERWQKQGRTQQQLKKASDAHTLTWIMPPMFCMGLNI